MEKGTLLPLKKQKEIAFHGPELAIFVGVSGGIKDVDLGDIVAADKVYYYESGKWMSESDGTAEFNPRPMVFCSGYRLVELAKSLARGIEYHEWLGPEEDEPRSSILVGPIASGESVIASKSSEIYRLIQKNYGDSISVAMEDYGFLRAVYANPNVNARIISLHNRAHICTLGSVTE